MNNIKLVKGRHSLARGTNQEILRSFNGNLIVYDNESQSLFELPPLPEIISFFNLSLEASEMPENQENTSLEDETPMQQNEHFVQKSKHARLDKTQQSIRGIRNVCDEIDLNQNNNSNADSVKSSTAVWDDKAVLLFAVYKDHEDDFKNSAIKNDAVWDKIKTQLTIDGYNFTRTQIKDKWMNMRKNYMKVKDHNKQTGAKLKTYRYYEEMDDIYGHKPIVNPVSLASNMGNNSGIFSCSEDSAVEDDQVKRKSKVERQLSGWTEKFIKYSKEQENQREQRQAKKIAAIENAMKNFKYMMEKLIEKL